MGKTGSTYRPGGRVDALYFSRIHGTCLAMNREVLTATPREIGGTRVTVDLPADAGETQGTYLVARDGRSDYLGPTQADTQSDKADTQADARASGGTAQR